MASDKASRATIPSTESVNKLSELVLDRPPSCLEFLPDISSGFGNLLVVGTYQLEPDELSLEQTESGSPTELSTAGKPEPATQNRNGSLILLQFLQTDDQLRVLHTLDCPSAVYDLHFLGPGERIFAAASSTGTISFYRVDEKVLPSTLTQPGTTKTIIQSLWSAQVFPSTTIITFFQFVPTQLPYHGPLIAATTDDGGVYLMKYCLKNGTIDLLNDGNPITQHRIVNTPDNAWCCAAGIIDPSTIYSGGDSGDLIHDSISFGHSSPYEYDAGETLSQTHKYHDAGVTAILPVIVRYLEHKALLLTGSYDEFVRLYSTSDRKVLAKLHVGGGVYRLKYLGQVDWVAPHATTYAILATCMHAGTKVIHVKGSNAGNWSIEIVAGIDVPKTYPPNYVYAAGVQDIPPLPRSLGFVENRLCVSGTWLDKKLVVWSFIHKFKRPEEVVQWDDSNEIVTLPPELLNTLGTDVVSQGPFRTSFNPISET